MSRSEASTPEKNIPDFFTVTNSKTVGKSRSGLKIVALRLADRDGKIHLTYHVFKTEHDVHIFYDIEDAANF